MKRFLQRLLIASILIVSGNVGQYLHAQTTQVVSAKCGSCGKPVSKYARVGQRCPHCGVIWGRENNTTTYRNHFRKKTTTNSYNYPPPPDFSKLLDNSQNNYSNSSSYSTVAAPDVPDLSSLYASNTNTIRNCTLRAAPSTKSTSLGLIPKNSSVQIVKRAGEWVKISYMGGLVGSSYDFNSYTGWLHESNLVY